MKYFVLLILFALSLISLFSGCEEGDAVIDTEAPTVVLYQPEMHTGYDAGSYIPFKAQFTDNVALKTYSIDIHNNFDGHSHGRTFEDPELLKWAYKENFDLPEIPFHEEEMNDVISIPQQVMAGPYHFIVQSIDREGNATSFQNGSNIEVEILLTNSSMAQVNISNLIGDELVIEENTPFNVEGNIFDPLHQVTSLYGLEYILVTLGEPQEIEQHDHGRLLEDQPYLFEAEFLESEIRELMDDNDVVHIEDLVGFTLSIEEKAELDQEGIERLEFRIVVHDMQGNITVSITPVHIHE